MLRLISHQKVLFVHGTLTCHFFAGDVSMALQNPTLSVRGSCSNAHLKAQVCSLLMTLCVNCCSRGPRTKRDCMLVNNSPELPIPVRSEHYMQRFQAHFVRYANMLLFNLEVCPWYYEDPAQKSYDPLKLVQQSLRPLEGRKIKGLVEP